jgi:transposase
MPLSRKIWAGLDLGDQYTSICVIDDAGTILQQSQCPTRVECVHAELRWLRRRRFARIGLEASTSFSLARGLQSRGYSVDIFETRQLSKFLAIRRNKTDSNDARGIAEAGRLGGAVLSKVFLKSIECQALQSRLTLRSQLIRQRVAMQNMLCRQIRQYGGNLKPAKKALQLRSEAEREMRRVFGKVSTPLTSELCYLLQRCEELMIYQDKLDRELARLARTNAICRRFMEIPGIGTICALTFYCAVGEPNRFRRVADVGPYFGLTPKVSQSGQSVRPGRISRMGNSAVRSLLSRASLVIMRSNARQSGLRDWALRIEKRRGRARARVALARKLAVIMVAMWKSQEEFRPECAG